MSVLGFHSYLTASLHTFGTSVTNEEMLCNIYFTVTIQGHKAKVQGHTGLFLLGGYTSYFAQALLLSEWCVAHHLKRQWLCSLCEMLVCPLRGPCPFQGFSSYEVQIQPIGGRCIAYNINVKMSRSHGSFLSLLYPLHGSIPIERLRFIFITNRNHDWWICRTSFNGQTTKRTGLQKLLKCLSRTPYGTVPIWMTCLMFGTNTTHKGQICSALIPGPQI